MPKPKKSDGEKERERLMAREVLRRMQVANTRLLEADAMARAGGAPLEYLPEHVQPGTGARAGVFNVPYVPPGARRQGPGRESLAPEQLQGLENIERERDLFRTMDEGGTVRQTGRRSIVGDYPLPSEQAWLDAQTAEERARKAAEFERKQAKKKPKQESPLAKFGRMV